MHKALIIAVVTAALPVAASAQTPADAAYCNSLANTYVKYVGHDDGSPGRLVLRGTADGQVAVAECRAGRSAEAIPVLERELRRAGFTLPARG